MSNNKQSSIELFAIALYEGGYLQGNGDEINDLLERHKAMHKEEIIISNMNGQAEYDQLGYRDIVKDVAEQYYNETFKTQEK
jgi:hypothetical protein